MMPQVIMKKKQMVFFLILDRNESNEINRRKRKQCYNKRK